MQLRKKRDVKSWKKKKTNEEWVVMVASAAPTLAKVYVS